MLAVLYDIHGNLPALDAALAHAHAHGVDGYVLGGDYALFGAWPAETVARLNELPGASWVRGNGERWSASPSEAPSDGPVPGAIAACRDALGPELVAALALLPEHAKIGETRFCHASPVSDVRSFAPQPSPDEAELLADVAEKRLVFGHTHVPFARVSRAGREPVELFNPGSVGMPFDGDPRAAYALWDEPRGELEHVRVAYDHHASAAALRERCDGDWVDVAARRLERALP